MSDPSRGEMEKLIHDVNSQSSTLRSAAALLRNTPPREARELLALMVRQAEALARSVADFERERTS